MDTTLDKINEIHKLTRDALKGDVKSLEKVLDFLMSFGIPSFNVVAYLIVYQAIMNLSNDLANECQRCGGVCCRIGSEIPLYVFDLDDIKKHVQLNLNNIVMCSYDQCFLKRPCVFQEAWRCTIHKFKPYACLSYPFASEEVQYTIIANPTVIPPEPVVPEFCLAAKKIWNRIKLKIEEYKKNFNRDPNPVELFYLFLKNDEGEPL